MSQHNQAGTARQLGRPVTVLSDYSAPEPEQTLSKHLTTAELSEMIGVPALTIEGWRRRGGGPPFTKVKRGVRYDLAQVKSWLRANTRSVTA